MQLSIIAKDTLKYGLAETISRALSFLLFPIYAHLFSVEEFGLIALATSLTALLSSCFVGIHNALQRFYWDGANKASLLVSTSVFSLIGSTSLICILLSFVIYPMREYLQDTFLLTWPCLVIAMFTVIPWHLSTLCLGVLRLHFAPWAFALLSFVTQVGIVIWTLVLVLFFSWGVEGFLWGTCFGYLLSLPLGVCLIRKDLSNEWDPKTARELFSFGHPFLYTGIAYWMFSGMDRWMLGSLSSVYQVGLYSVALKFGMGLQLIKSAFSQAWSPYVMKLIHSEKEYRIWLSRIFTLWFYGLIVVGSAFTLFATECLVYFIPESYWEASYSLVFVMFGLVIAATTEITAIGITIAKKTYPFAYGTWITAGMNIVLNLICIPAWGASGAAFATLVSYVFLSLYYLFYTQKFHPLPLEKNQLLFCVGICLVSLLFCLSLASYHVIHFGLIGVKCLFLVVLVGMGYRLFYQRQHLFS